MHQNYVIYIHFSLDKNTHAMNNHKLSLKNAIASPLWSSLSPILLSSVKTEESIGFVKIFDFRFLMDLHALGCLEPDLTISESVCMHVAKILWQV